MKKDAPDWFGCGREITNESWEGFKAARAAYYKRVDEAEALGVPNDPLLGHPQPVASNLSRTATDTAQPLPQNLQNWLDEHTPEIGLPLDKTESFTQWLDQQGDSLAPADSFTEWLRQNDDSL